MRSLRPFSILSVLLAAMLMTPANSDPMKVEVKQFGGAVTIPKRASDVSYHWPLATEKFVVMTPADYDPKKSYGLLVDISPSNDFIIPRSWGPVLAQKNMLLVAPLKVGNDQDPARRMGMAVLGAQAMKRDFNIDSQRVYVSGLSGGARTANVVAFYHPETFKGAIPICGASFYKSITAKNGTGGSKYARLIRGGSTNINAVKSGVKFALVTGSGDFRQGDVQDIYQHGYERENFRARLFDVDGMGHQYCSGQTLAEVLGYLDSRP